MIDTKTDVGARVAQRLEHETLAWLVTVGSDGTPQPSPIWFLWDGSDLLIFSQPNQAKLRNIARQPNVAVHFDSDGRGGNIVVLTGVARIEPSAPGLADVPAYLSKYRQAIAGIGLTPESMAQTYSVAIRVTPTRVRAY